MSFTDVEAYVAEYNLRLIEANGFVSCFSTIWKGEPLVINFSNITFDILSIPVYFGTLDEEEIAFIQNLLADYYISGKESSS